MPPASNIRKSSTQAMTAGDSTTNPTAARNGVQPRRTARANTTRPANYYARPFGSFSTGVDHDNDAADSANMQQAGFFPALQYFTDAISALPKEVQKQITLVKEVEAKVHGPNEQMGEILDTLLEHPVPARKQTAGTGASASNSAGLLTLTANNSTSGSTNVSLVNGATGRHSAQPSLVGSVNGDDAVDAESERARRHMYQNLRMVTHALLANLDEKNVVLSEATRVLALQQSRIDSVWPQVESELSEEARMGSMAHWAYSDNRQKTKTGASGAQNRRDVAATNSLAAAASILHETEIAQARRDAGREATRDKTKGKRTEQPGDSDFDDKPRKAVKVGKGKAAANAAATGLGISANGEPATKTKKVVDKGLAAPGMERTVSATGKAAKVNKETPRSTPATEPTVKKTKGKPGPPPKKKVPNSAQNSPMLASSPLVASSNPMIEPPGARPQSARARQNSTATNLRHEKLQDEEAITSRPTSASGKSNGNGERINGRRKVHETTEEHDDNMGDEHADRQLKDAAAKLKHEDTDMPDAGAERTAASRSGSDSRKNSGRNSKVGTPRTDSYPNEAPSMSRKRSTRSALNARGEGEDSDSVEPPLTDSGAGKHRRHASNSHLVKQLAPFNKSPDLDRHKDNGDDGDDRDEDVDSLEEKNLGEDEAEAEQPEEEEAPVLDQETRRSSTRRPASRRNTVNNLRSSPAPMSRESSPPVSPPPTNTRGSGRSSSRREAEVEPTHLEIEEAEPAVQAEPEDEDEESEHDPDDPDEPKYCYCNRGSYGEMVACDNESCPREWFHLGCTELREAPSEEVKWYCRECRPLFGQKVGRKGKAGRGRGG